MSSSLADPLVVHQRAQEAFGAVLSRIEVDHLDNPTPCEEWKVRDLLTHVIGANQRIGGLEVKVPSTIPELLAAHSESAAAAHSGFAAPDGLTRVVKVPFGEISGLVFIGLRIADVFTHAWDLAKATGQSTDLDPDLAAATLDRARTVVGPGLRGPAKPFGAEQLCPPGRPAADRLAAFLGRPLS